MKIYIGNFSYKTPEIDLQMVIEEYGREEYCKINKDRDTGKPKGFAYIEVTDNVFGTKATDELNGA